MLDCLAFVLGMLAGCSFLSRMTKYLLERNHIFDYTAESYVEFIDEKDKTDNNISRNDAEIVKEKNSVNLDPQTNNNPDSMSQLNPQVKLEMKSVNAAKN